jgi:LysM repeat protein
MAARSPARFLAPLALLAVIGALYLIVKPQSAGDSGSATPAATTQPAKKQTASKKSAAKKHKTPKSYTVQPGDTPSGIADKAGISLAELEALNPSLDPQALAPGEKLKLK